MNAISRAACYGLFILLFAMTGCFEWTEDPQGSVTSVGLPGAAQPVWQSKSQPAPLKPTDMGMTPEEAANVGGPVLVMPPSATVHTWRYRYYRKDDNHCQADLDKILAERAQNGESGDAPYCAEAPSAPPNKASFVLF